MPPVAPDHASFRSLLELVDTGTCWVKLSAPYESSPTAGPDHPEVADLARRLVTHAPHRMLWATNWPHPSLDDDRPDAADLTRWRDDWIADASVRRRVLVDNPAELYGFDSDDPPGDPPP